MIEGMDRKSKLIPVFFVILLFAFVVRVGDVKQGIGLVVTPAFALEPTAMASEKSARKQDPNNKAGEKKNRAGTIADKAPSDSVQEFNVESSDVEDVLLQFKEQRDKLNAREKVLYDLQAKMFSAAEKKITDRIAELKTIEIELNKLLGLYSENEEKQLARVVKMYETMKAKLAAPRFEKLDLKIQVDLAMRIKEKNMASILELMTLKGATVLTDELAIQKKTPTIAELKQSTLGQ